MTTDLVLRLRRAGCVFAEDEAALLVAQAESPIDLESMVVARERGEPLEHIVGWVDFAGLRLRLGPGVFVPRPRSEFLVDAAAEALAPAGMLLDLCSGCGAIGLAVGARVPARVHLAELDPVAARWAALNAGDRAAVHVGDLFAAIPDDLRGQFTVITVVAPYVPSTEIALLPHEARDHEPRGALDGGADGLDLLRRIVADARDWLAPTGVLLAEIGERQAPAARVILADGGLESSLREGPDGETVVRGRQPAGTNR